VDLRGPPSVLGPVPSHHTAAAERLTAPERGGRERPAPDRVIVGLDEHLNAPEVWSALRVALVAGHLFATTALWHEIRERDSGRRILVKGASPIGVRDEYDWGRFVEYVHWHDPEIAAFALARLETYRHVVLATGEEPGAREELRRVLADDVGPVLNRDPRHGRSLVLIGKRPQSSLARFGRRLADYLSRGRFRPGYRELLF